MAGGLTPAQVATDIQKKLGAYVRDPQVAVILTELRSHEYLSRVRVTGAVRQPVSIPYRQGMTVLDAVLAEGCVNEFAAPDRSRLSRRRDGGAPRYAVTLAQSNNDSALATQSQVPHRTIDTVPRHMGTR